MDHEIPAAEKTRILAAWNRFRASENAQNLASLGWNAQSLLAGMRPEQAKTWADMPALPVLLADGGRIVRATHLDIEIRLKTGTRLFWKKCCWVGEKLEKLMNETRRKPNGNRQ